MNFPTDPEIREYASYYIRAIGVFKEEFRNTQGRPPTEFEIQDFSKMGIIPYGLVPKNGNPNGSSQPGGNTKQPVQPLQPKRDTKPQKQVAESITDLVNRYRDYLKIEGERVVIIKNLGRNDYFDLLEEMRKRGWKKHDARHVGGTDWEPGYFEMEGAKP